jgi:hypothetical protein
MESERYGVCRLALVSVRQAPNHKAEQVTQLLFGDHYEVLPQLKDKGWLSVRIHADQCEGWIDVHQHHEITHAYFQQINNANYKIVTDPVTTILYKKNPLTILMGSIVPISNSELFKMEEQFAFNGESKSLGQRRDFEFLRSVAVKYLGVPFQWGGKSPFGIDAPGLVQNIFKITGYNLPRSIDQQKHYGRPVEETEFPLPGDLIFFQNLQEHTDHVGIMLNGDQVIHAWGKVRIDHLMEEGIQNLETKLITHTTSMCRRVMLHQ